MIWRLLDIIFVLFHTLVVFFNLFGWIWKRTRKYNLILLLLTGGSWLFLGLLFGTLGYCPLTDWHFDVLEKLGRTDLPVSYIKYLADRLTGLNLSSSLVDTVTLYSFLTSLIISLFLNIRDYRAKQFMILLVALVVCYLNVSITLNIITKTIAH